MGAAPDTKDCALAVIATVDLLTRETFWLGGTGPLLFNWLDLDLFETTDELLNELSLLKILCLLAFVALATRFLYGPVVADGDSIGFDY